MLLACQVSFALFFNQVFNTYFILNDDVPADVREEAFKLFGTFCRSILSMFELTLGNWVPITRFLCEKASEWFTFFLLVYHCIVAFAVVTVIRGIFLHETFQVA